MAGTLVGIAAKRQIPSWRGQDLNLRPSGYEGANPEVLTIQTLIE